MTAREMTKEEQAAHIEELRKEAEALGIDYKGNWGIPKLTKEIEAAKDVEVEEEEVEETIKLNPENEEVAEEEVPAEEVPKDDSGETWLYKGNAIRTAEVRELLLAKVNEVTADREIENMKTGKPYTSAIIGVITFIKSK